MGTVRKVNFGYRGLRTEQKPRIYFQGGEWHSETREHGRINTALYEANMEAAYFAIGKNEELYEQEQKEKAAKAP